MIRTHPSRSELEAFDRGLLHPAQWAEIEPHVAECETCCRLLEEIPDDPLVTLLKTSSERVLSVTPTDGPLSPDTPVALPQGPAAARAELPAGLQDHPRYRVLERIGSGGMGTVFKAEHRLMQRLVALKVIHPDLLARPGGVERFRQEARAAALLAHPNIATAYDADQAGATHFLVMEFVEGETLDRVLKRRAPLPWREVYDWVRQVAEGLQHACERGMVHRDLKPANLLLTPQGKVKILDFGLARLVSEAPLEARAAPVTPVGAVVGTPQYLAPEQARDPQSADIRADLYSLGCTWYELLTDQPLFPAGTLLQQLLAHQDQAARPLAEFRTDLPLGLDAVLQRLLEKGPERRWQTPAELLTALQPWAGFPSAPPAPKPRTARFGPTVIGMILGAVLLCLLVWAGWHALAVLRPDSPADPHPAPPAQVDAGVPAAPALPGPLSALDQAAAWLAANSIYGPASNMVHDNVRKLHQGVTDGKAFGLELSARLVKSAQPTLLVGRRHDFFVFELPPGALRIRDFEAILRTSAEQNQEFQAPAAVHLTDLRIDQQTIDGTNLSGTMAFRASRAISGRLATRLTLMPGKSTKTMHNTLETHTLRGQGTIRFHFTALYSETSRPSVPVRMLFDLSILDDPASKAKSLVVSNDLALVVVAQQAILPKSREP